MYRPVARVSPVHPRRLPPLLRPIRPIPIRPTSNLFR
jgi:hypothetical protein